MNSRWAEDLREFWALLNLISVFVTGMLVMLGAGPPFLLLLAFYALLINFFVLVFL